MKVADYDVDVELTANAYECVDDDKLFTMEPRETWDTQETACPNDYGHYVRPILISPAGEIPDGVPADVAADFYHPGRGRYEFALDPDS